MLPFNGGSLQVWRCPLCQSRCAGRPFGFSAGRRSKFWLYL